MIVVAMSLLLFKTLFLLKDVFRNETQFSNQKRKKYVPGNAQIAHFDYLAFGQKDILGFQIAMQNVFLVHVLQVREEKECP